jgi:hypothetical protein
MKPLYTTTTNINLHNSQHFFQFLIKIQFYKQTPIIADNGNREPAFFFYGPQLFPLHGNIVPPDLPRDGIVLLIDVFHRPEPDDYASLTLPVFVPTDDMMAARRPLNVRIPGIFYNQCTERLGLFDPQPPQRGEEWYARRLFELLKGSQASRTLKHLRYCSQPVDNVPNEIVASQDWLEEMCALRVCAKLENADGRPKEYLRHHMVRGTDWEDRVARDFADYGHVVIPEKYNFPRKPVLLEAGTIYHPYYYNVTVSIDRIVAQSDDPNTPQDDFIIEIKCPSPREILAEGLPPDYNPESPSILPELRKVYFYEDKGPFDRRGTGDYYHQVNMQAFVLNIQRVFLVKYNILTGGMCVVRCHIDPDWFSKYGPELFRAQRDVLRLRRDTDWTVQKHESLNA